MLGYFSDAHTGIVQKPFEDLEIGRCQCAFVPGFAKENVGFDFFDTRLAAAIAANVSEFMCIDEISKDANGSIQVGVPKKDSRVSPNFVKKLVFFDRPIWVD